MNSAAQQQNPVSPYPGVRMHRPKHASHRWIGRVTHNGKRIAVPGRYDTAIEAHNARCDFLVKLGLAAPAKIVAEAA